MNSPRTPTDGCWWFGELIDWLRGDEASNNIYLTALKIAALDDLESIDLLSRATAGRFFSGSVPKDANVLHHDLTNNLLVQVMGRKRVRMAPPPGL